MSGQTLVLGGSGFIGTRLGGLLQERGVPFRIGDIRESETFPELWQRCDVRDLEMLRPVVKGAETIINLAAEHRDDVRPLSLYDEVNVDGAARVCEAAREAVAPILRGGSQEWGLRPGTENVAGGGGTGGGPPAPTPRAPGPERGSRGAAPPPRRRPRTPRRPRVCPPRPPPPFYCFTPPQHILSFPCSLTLHPPL